MSRNTDGSLNYLSPGLGTWLSTADGVQFTYVYNRLLDQATRTLVATTWVDLTAIGDGDEWSGIWKRRDLDANGSVALETGGSIRGHRQSLEPL